MTVRYDRQRRSRVRVFRAPNLIALFSRLGATGLLLPAGPHPPAVAPALAGTLILNFGARQLLIRLSVLRGHIGKRRREQHGTRGDDPKSCLDHERGSSLAMT